VNSVPAGWRTVQFQSQRIPVVVCRPNSIVNRHIERPRTLEQLEQSLPAANLRLEDDLLDQIDKLVVPGTDVDPVGDASWTAPWLAEAAVRRRSRR
jgi:hypothetical protein